MQFSIYPLFLFCWLNLPFFVQAQIIDDFSDGNFSHNPAWFGQDSLFQINANKQLQSKAFNNQSGERVLFTQQTIYTEMEWRVWLRFVFNPSAQNQVKWILSATDSSLTNSFYVQLGGSTGTTDSISLYKEVNGQKFCVIAGRPATVGKTNNILQLKVTRDGMGNWELLSDTGTANIFISEGRAQDNSPSLGIIHGFSFRCTSGNVSNFYADNLYAGMPILDKTVPQLLHFEMLNAQQISLHFSEKVKPILGQQIGFSQLQKAQASSQNQQTWLFNLDEPILIDSFFSMDLKNISDLADNVLDTQIIWAYHPLQKGDIILTELLPDPEPILGLPNAEFVELYNHTRFPVQLSDFSLNDPSSQGNIAPMVLEPYQFIILCAAKDTSLFKPFGKTIGLTPWPSLNNSSDTIILKYKQEIWHQIDYQLGYYQSKEKELGGYSLSLINPNHLCYGDANWIGSASAIGGTPGKTNDVWVANKDTSSAQLTAINFLNAQEIELLFNKEIMFQEAWKNSLQIQGLALSNIWVNANNPNIIHLLFSEPLIHQKTYQFELYPLIDCLQNSGKQQVQFSYLKTIAPKQNELLITEIYYDETRKGNFPQFEFIELYNPTQHPINLQNMQFADVTSLGIFPNYILAAKSYLIVCHQNHTNAFSAHGKTLGLANWPSLNTSDVLSIRDSNGFLLHQVAYADSWLKSSAKVFSCSIEMIDLNNPCAGANNWLASTNTNGASLGASNSVAAPNTDKTAAQLERIYVRNLHQLQLSFSESLDSLSLLDSYNFGLNQTHYPKNFYLDQHKRNLVFVNYEKPLQAETDYTLQIPILKDCALNQSEPIQSLTFQVPLEPKNGDIIINEIMFNPMPNAYDFIELYNVSNTHLDLSKLQLCKAGNQGILEEYQIFAEEGVQLAPQQYMAIAEFPNLAQNNLYAHQVADWISHKIPVMNDDEGTILLLNEQHTVLDSVNYTDQMHVSFLRQTEGVSLERINPHLPGSYNSNWASAAQTVNFSSPAQKNSQHKIGSAQSGMFSCLQSYFSPDSDGWDELLTFQYQTGEAQWVADLFIYDLQGKLVKEVCKSKLLASNGELHWAGDTNQGTRANIGNYIAFWSCTSSKGEIEQQKIVVSLLSK
jgi:hypothetical protein